jgi:hypothetical protein
MGPDIAIVVGGWAFALGVLVWSEHNWPALMRWLARSAVFAGAVLVTLWGRYDLTAEVIAIVVISGLLLSGLPVVHELVFHAARAPRQND